MKATMYRVGAAASAVGIVLSASVASAAPDSRPGPVARVTGSAEVRLPYWPDNDVRTFTFDATAAPYSRPIPDGGPAVAEGLPTDAIGTVHISHRVADNGMTVRMVARVDCLATGPGIAALTAVVTEADEVVRDQIGKRLGFSVYDAGRRGADRMGFSWDVVNADQNDTGKWVEGRAGTCMGPGPFAPVTRGDYTVRHQDLLPVPSQR
jgi:hypothetical protein